MEINEVNIRKRKELYSEIYSSVINDTMLEKTPYFKLIEEQFERFKIPSNMIAQVLGQMTQTATTTSQQIALQLLLESDRIELENERIKAEIEKLKVEKEKVQADVILAQNQAKLAEKEAELTGERIKLVKAQTEAELAKIPLVKREIKVYDDNLRVKEAEALKDMINGYNIGGTEVPSELYTQAFNKIAKITDDE